MSTVTASAEAAGAIEYDCHHDSDPAAIASTYNDANVRACDQIKHSGAARGIVIRAGGGGGVWGGAYPAVAQ